MPTNTNFRTNMQIADQENEGVPLRQPATALLTIDTADRQIFDLSGYRVDSTSPFQVYINTQQNIMSGFFTRIAVTELNMNWNIPNVIGEGSQKNNTLTVEIEGAPGNPPDRFTATVPQGFYTQTALATALQTALTAQVDVGWTVTYNNFTDGQAFAIEATDPDVFFRIVPQNKGMADDLCNMMGFSSPLKTFVQRLIGSFASMLYTPYFDIVSQQLTKKQNILDNGTSFITGKNVLARVYIAKDGLYTDNDDGEALNTTVGTEPFRLYKEWQVPKQIFWDTKEFINVIDLSLVDYKGRILYSPPQQAVEIAGKEVGQCGNSANYQITLQITET